VNRVPYRRMRRRSRAQSVVEFAFVAPVMVLMFMGAWTAADLITDNNTAAQATRAGARYGVEIGNGGYPKSSASCDSSSLGVKDPCQVDTDIIDQMLPIVASKFTDATPQQVIIYEPDGCTGTTPFVSGSCPPDNGAYCCSEPEDVWNVSSGTPTEVSESYTLDMRLSTHPSETELGVEITFSYTSPTLQMFTQTDTQYTVMRLAPTE
jgi:TadE-like protein